MIADLLRAYEKLIAPCSVPNAASGNASPLSIRKNLMKKIVSFVHHCQAQQQLDGIKVIWDEIM
jgi:hypothetical protein